MEKKAFENVLKEALNFINVGIQSGYLMPEKEKELNIRLAEVLKNGIEYDIPGNAIYGEYNYNEKKVRFNSKVFNDKESAMIYIIHELKHAIDDNGEYKGFQSVGMNEGATQRFATDVAEKILGKEIISTSQRSLGVKINTNLDEYQIEDRLNELFYITMGIEKQRFILMQNDNTKSDYNNMIQEFNKYADYEIFINSLDEIYKMQESTWVDEEGNILESERKLDDEELIRVMELINNCKKELINYANVKNREALNSIYSETFIPEQQYIMRDCGTIIKLFDEYSIENNSIIDSKNVEYNYNLEKDIEENNKKLELKNN